MRIFRIPPVIFRLFPKIVWKKATTHNYVCLSFDDGPDSIYTPEILNILQKHSVQASFFVLGNKAQQLPGLIQQVQKSHVIGIHSFEHRRLVFRSTEYLYDQLNRSKQIVEKIIEQPVRYFRSPYGFFSPRLIRICTQLKMQLVMWSIMSYDFDKNVSDTNILKQIETKVTNGDIIVFHDGHHNSRRTIRILEPTINILKKNGFKLSSIDK